VIESERRTARMQTSLVVAEGRRRRGNAGDASRYRPEGVYSLDASRFIGVSFGVSFGVRFVLRRVVFAPSSHGIDAQNIA
jgi:hypothetical protein